MEKVNVTESVCGNEMKMNERKERREIGFFYISTSKMT